eukprot:5981812-Amphidinium_carterae.1
MKIEIKQKIAAIEQVKMTVNSVNIVTKTRQDRELLKHQPLAFFDKEKGQRCPKRRAVLQEQTSKGFAIWSLCVTAPAAELRP